MKKAIEVVRIETSKRGLAVNDGDEWCGLQRSQDQTRRERLDAAAARASFCLTDWAAVATRTGGAVEVRQDPSTSKLKLCCDLTLLNRYQPILELKTTTTFSQTNQPTMVKSSDILLILVAILFPPAAAAVSMPLQAT